MKDQVEIDILKFILNSLCIVELTEKGRAFIKREIEVRENRLK